MILRFFPICFLALISLSAVAIAQSCPNQINFGTGLVSTKLEGETRQVTVEVTYFRTLDPGVFVSERNSLSASASTARLSSVMFQQRLEQLVRQGSAFVDGNTTKELLIGEVSEVNLLRSPALYSAEPRSFSHVRTSSGQSTVLERTTSLRVSRRPYDSSNRVDLRSYFVQSTRDENADEIPDLDASSLLGMGETIVYKLTSDNEVARANGWRTYIALTMRTATD